MDKDTEPLTEFVLMEPDSAAVPEPTLAQLYASVRPVVVEVLQEVWTLLTSGGVGSGPLQDPWTLTSTL